MLLTLSRYFFVADPMAGAQGGTVAPRTKIVFASGTVVMYDADTLNTGGKKNDQ
jgi:hypothetical protein